MSPPRRSPAASTRSPTVVLRRRRSNSIRKQHPKAHHDGNQLKRALRDAATYPLQAAAHALSMLASGQYRNHPAYSENTLLGSFPTFLQNRSGTTDPTIFMWWSALLFMPYMVLRTLFAIQSSYEALEAEAANQETSEHSPEEKKILTVQNRMQFWAGILGAGDKITHGLAYAADRAGMLPASIAFRGLALLLGAGSSGTQLQRGVATLRQEFREATFFSSTDSQYPEQMNLHELAVHYPRIAPLITHAGNCYLRGRDSHLGNVQTAFDDIAHGLVQIPLTVCAMGAGFVAWTQNPETTFVTLNGAYPIPDWLHSAGIAILAIPPLLSFAAHAASLVPEFILKSAYFFAHDAKFETDPHKNLRAQVCTDFHANILGSIAATIFGYSAYLSANPATIPHGVLISTLGLLFLGRYYRVKEN